MNKKLPIPQPNRASYLRHKRETNRQILLPVLLSSLVILALFALIAYATFTPTGNVTRWAAVSTIWIIIPVMIFMLIGLALLVAMVYGMRRLLQITPDYTGAAQEYVLRITAKIQWYTQEFTQRILRFRAWVDTLQALLKRK